MEKTSRLPSITEATLDSAASATDRLDLRGLRQSAQPQPSVSEADDCVRCGCIALVEGSQPLELTAEVQTLLRRRLRLAAMIFFAGFLAFFVRHALLVDYHSAFGLTLFAFHGLVIVVLGALSALLFWRRAATITTARLRVAELLIFGLPAAFFLAMQSSLAIQRVADGYFHFEGGPWMALIFIYALFIPNTIRRASIVIGLMASAPILLLAALWAASPEMGRLISPDQMASLPIMLAVSALAAVLGVDTIGHLREEAFEARRLGQYLLKQRIGAGGMGEVYLAEHYLLKRPCVVKLIRPDKAGDPRVLARFEREVRATATLSHWNTIEIFDFGMAADGTFYYVMEFLPGMSLQELVERFGPMPPQRAIYLLRQACDALHEAHCAGLLHRDIKPGNIFAARLGGVYDVAKLLDFGLVKPLMASQDDSLQLTTEGSITGSPLYMSPEQVLGENEPDPRSDIYSLGAVAYYLLTGRPPFQGDKPMKVMIAHVQQEVTPPSQLTSEIPADLEEVVLRCLAKSPGDRFSDAASLDAALAQCESAGIWSRRHAADWWREVECK